jgi:hypothetical protein
MPEIHRENRHRADTAQRKTCQTVQKPDINNDSFSGPGNLRLRVTGISSVVPPINGISGGCVAMRKPELEQSCFWRAPGTRASPRRRPPGLDVWTVPFGAPFPIGNEDMTCPARGLLPAVDRVGYGMRPVAWPGVVVASNGVITEFMRCYRRPDRRRRTGLNHNRAPRPSLSRGGTPSGGASCRPAPPFSRSLSHPLRDAALRRPRLAPTSGLRTLAGGTGPLRVAPERVSHGQQNAYRCVSPRRNQSGRPSR